MSFTSGQILTAAQLNTFAPGTRITNADGSSSAPAYSFSTDDNTGFYVTGNEGRIRFVGDGTPGGWLSNTGIRTVDGSASVPSYSFTSDSNTGMFRSGTDEIGLATGGTQRLTIQSDGDVGIGTTSPSVRLHVNAGTTNNTALFESTDSTTYVSIKDNSTSGNNHVAIGAVGDEMRLRANDTNLVKLVDPSLQMTATDGTLIAASPPTGTGNDAEWVTAFALKVLSENTSVAASKENITTDLGTHLTAEMIDSVVPKMWNRIHAPGIPEIGPIAEDMDAISPFLAAHGTDAEGEQILTGINKTGYLSLLVLAVKDLRTRVAALESA